jgi:hypothetical protein
MADSHTLNDHTVATGAPVRRDRALPSGMMIAAGALLATAPIVVTSFVPERPASVAAATTADAALIAFTGSAIELDGAIMKFSKQGNAINFSLMASDDGQRVFVQDAAGELFEIPVSPGQTNVSAELPAHFAASDTLSLRVD